jgi:hypothetical protein
VTETQRNVCADPRLMLDFLWVSRRASDRKPGGRGARGLSWSRSFQSGNLDDEVRFWTGPRPQPPGEG